MQGARMQGARILRARMQGARILLYSCRYEYQPPRSCHLAPPRLPASLALPAPLTCRPCCRCSLIAAARCRPGSPTMLGNPVP